MKKLLLVLLIAFGTTVEAQLHIGILANQEATADPNAYEYIFNGTATAYFITDYDLNGLYNQSFVFKGTIDNITLERPLIGTNSSTAMYLRYDTSTGDIVFSLTGDGGTSSVSPAWTHDTSEHIWIATYNGTNMTVYLDGTQLGTNVDADFLGHSVSRPVYIGSRAGNSARILIGSSDVVQVYNRALTSGEVTTLQSNLQGVSSGRVLNLWSNKGVSDWLDDDNSKTATNQGGVTRALK